MELRGLNHQRTLATLVAFFAAHFTSCSGGVAGRSSGAGPASAEEDDDQTGSVNVTDTNCALADSTTNNHEGGAPIPMMGSNLALNSAECKPGGPNAKAFLNHALCDVKDGTGKYMITCRLGELKDKEFKPVVARPANVKNIAWAPLKVQVQSNDKEPMLHQLDPEICVPNKEGTLLQCDVNFGGPVSAKGISAQTFASVAMEKESATIPAYVTHWRYFWNAPKTIYDGGDLAFDQFPSMDFASNDTQKVLAFLRADSAFDQYNHPFRPQLIVKRFTADGPLPERMIDDTEGIQLGEGSTVKVAMDDEGNIVVAAAGRDKGVAAWFFDQKKAQWGERKEITTANTCSPYVKYSSKIHLAFVRPNQAVLVYNDQPGQLIAHSLFEGYWSAPSILESPPSIGAACNATLAVTDRGDAVVARVFRSGSKEYRFWRYSGSKDNWDAGVGFTPAILDGLVDGEVLPPLLFRNGQNIVALVGACGVKRYALVAFDPEVMDFQRSYIIPNLEALACNPHYDNKPFSYAFASNNEGQAIMLFNNRGGGGIQLFTLSLNLNTLEAGKKVLVGQYDGYDTVDQFAITMNRRAEIIGVFRHGQVFRINNQSQDNRIYSVFTESQVAGVGKRTGDIRLFTIPAYNNEVFPNSEFKPLLSLREDNKVDLIMREGVETGRDSSNGDVGALKKGDRKWIKMISGFRLGQ